MKRPDDDICISCKVAVSGGMLIKEYCKEDCSDLIEEFKKGNLSIRDIQKRLNIPEELLEPFKLEDVPLDMTLAQAVEEDNKREKGKKHLTD